MNAEQMAEYLHGLLVEVMDRWNAALPAHAVPLHRMCWDQLDPVSRRLYIQRCQLFLDRFVITPKYAAGAGHG